MKYTVDAIAKYNDKIVLIERGRGPMGIALPGGHVEEGESLETAIRRELKEETDLNISSMQQFRTYSDPYRDPRGHYISTVFVCETYGKPKAGDDAKTTKLITLEDYVKFKDDFAFDHYQILGDYKESLEQKSASIEDMIWEVHYMSHDYEGDPFDEMTFFVADSKDDALEQAYSKKKKYKRLKENEKLVVTAIPLDNLHVARDCSNDGRGRFYSTQYIQKIDLISDNYKLGISLVPK